MSKLLKLLIINSCFLLSCSDKNAKSILSGKNKKIKVDSNCTDIFDFKKNPLARYQWHLKNIGQNPFSSEGGRLGEDINIYSVLKDKCLSGKGVYVAIIDSGLQLNHPSLAPNIDNKPYISKTWSLNFANNNGLPSYDPSPLSTAKSDHGTMVAGIIGMRSNLGFGGTGVAPRVNLSGYNLINQSAQNFNNFLDALGLSHASKGNDIFNMSYGVKNVKQIESNSLVVKAIYAAMKYGTRNLRNGKGAIYIKAAGNGFLQIGDNRLECSVAKRLGVSCQNSNMNFENTLYELIVVGALNAKGTKSSYGTTGSSIWISAPGGEFGVDKTWVEKLYQKNNENIDWSKYANTVGEPGIITTDISGSKNGYSRKIKYDDLAEVYDVGSAFNACEIEENDQCDYTNSMNGSSAAAPIISGVVALMLEKNPSLTWRDVKYILAKTARKVDQNFKNIVLKIDENTEYILEEGWITNKAGFSFSNWYGFGVVDVAKAIELSKNYSNVFSKFIEKDWITNRGTVILPNHFSAYQSEIYVPKSESLKIESVQIKVTIQSEYIGDVALELMSPHGTKSIIWHAGNVFSSNGNLVDMQIQSNAFYGEKNYGAWKLRVVNTGYHKKDVMFKQWKIKFSGH